MTARGWLTTSLAAQWAMEQLIENAVAIQMGSKSAVYIKLPDGSYNPPPGVAATLVQSNGVYRLEEPLGVRYDFGTNHRISAWQDASGNKLMFSYNAQTNLATVTNSFGRGLSFTYSGATQLVSIADSSGRNISFGYNAGNLTSYTDPEGHVWTYAYDSNRWMRCLVNPLLQTTVTNTYDVNGMVVTQRNATGHEWSFYVVPNWRSVEQDPFGGRTTYYFDDQGRQIAVQDALGNRHSVEYDGQGQVTNKTDPRGFGTAYQYDAHHNRTNVVDAFANSTAYTYDAHHCLITARDALGNATHYQYDACHRVTNVVDALSNRTATTYFSNGLPQTVTGPRGEVTA
ncbi:MAG: transglutaminase, partial [Kiritimatiellia bacterium]